MQFNITNDVFARIDKFIEHPGIISSYWTTVPGYEIDVALTFTQQIVI
jgi:hypothetical protein